MIKAREKRINSTLRFFSYEINEWAEEEFYRIQEDFESASELFKEKLGSLEFRTRTQQLFQQYKELQDKNMDIFAHVRGGHYHDMTDGIQKECLSRGLAQYLYDTFGVTEGQLEEGFLSEDNQNACCSVIARMILQLMGGSNITLDMLNLRKNKSDLALEDTHWCDSREEAIRGHRYTAYDLANQFAHLLGWDSKSDSVDMVAMYLSDNLRNYDAYTELHACEDNLESF